MKPLLLVISVAGYVLIYIGDCLPGWNGNGKRLKRGSSVSNMSKIDELLLLSPEKESSSDYDSDDSGFVEYLESNYSDHGFKLGRHKNATVYVHRTCDLGVEKKTFVQYVFDKYYLSDKLDEAGNKLVVISFLAKWSDNCAVVAPKLEKLAKKCAKKYPDVVFLKVDVDVCENLVDAYDITTVPAYAFVRNRRKIGLLLGAKLVRLEQKLLEHIGAQKPQFF